MKTPGSTSPSSCCYNKETSKSDIVQRALLVGGIALVIIGILALSSQFSNPTVATPGVMSKISSLWERFSTSLSANPLHLSILVSVIGAVLIGFSSLAMGMERCRKHAITQTTATGGTPSGDLVLPATPDAHPTTNPSTVTVGKSVAENDADILNDG